MATMVRPSRAVFLHRPLYFPQPEIFRTFLPVLSLILLPHLSVRHMPKIKTPTPSQELRSFLHMLLDPQKEYNHVVKPEMQAKQLEDLDAIIPNESFYFVFNLQTAEFDQVKGIEQWLGYPGQEFSVNRY